MLRRLDRSGGERAISPLVAGALLVAIVVLLAAVTGVIVLGIGDEDPPAPSARLTLEPASGCEFQLVHRGGDEIDGDRVTVQGLQDPNALSARELTAEDAVSVTPSDERVRVVWNAPDGDTDYILRAFSVDPTAIVGWACSPGTVLTGDSSGRIRAITPGEDPITLSARTRSVRRRTWPRSASPTSTSPTTAAVTSRSSPTTTRSRSRTSRTRRQSSRTAATSPEPSKGRRRGSPPAPGTVATRASSS